ncbi:MAG TPA: hypothetical protein GX506_10040 [Firmicutes bacterium]|nr:hypothetical protein [Bacillota bacterium]
MDISVVGVGHSCIDYVGLVNRIPAADERAIIKQLTCQVGGLVATALAALARLGVKVGFVGKVGDDALGQMILKEFTREGIDISRVVVEKGASSSASLVLTEEGTGRRTIGSYRAFEDLSEDEMDRDYITSGKFVHVDGRFPKASLLAARWAREKGLEVTFDCDQISPHVEETIRFTDYLIADEAFPADFTGHEDVVEAATALLRLGPKAVVVTLGRKGCVAVTAQGIIRQPAFEVKAVNTLGAGDVFHGAFLYGLLQGWGLEDNLRFASLVAAIKCTRLGGWSSLPTLNEVKDFVSEAGISFPLLA